MQFTIENQTHWICLKDRRSVITSYFPINTILPQTLYFLTFCKNLSVIRTMATFYTKLLCKSIFCNKKLGEISERFRNERIRSNTKLLISIKCLPVCVEDKQAQKLCAQHRNPVRLTRSALTVFPTDHRYIPELLRLSIRCRT